MHEDRHIRFTKLPNKLPTHTTRRRGTAGLRIRRYGYSLEVAVAQARSHCCSERATLRAHTDGVGRVFHVHSGDVEACWYGFFEQNRAPDAEVGVGACVRISPLPAE